MSRLISTRGLPQVVGESGGMTSSEFYCFGAYCNSNVFWDGNYRDTGTAAVILLFCFGFFPSKKLSDGDK